MTAKQVSKALAARALDVAAYLLPKGSKQGNNWVCADVRGGVGNSLKVVITGDKSGVWCDFCTGDAGDLLDLWSLCRNISLRQTIAEAEDYLGIKKIKLDGQKSTEFRRPVISNSSVYFTTPDIVDYFFKERKIYPITLEMFKISEKNGDIVFPYWQEGQLIAAKYLKLARENGKKVMFTEKNCEPCLFGWQALDSRVRTLAICEGEIDAMSLSQCGIPALSVPFGAGTGAKHQWIEYEYDRLSMYDEIFVCMDNDEPGRQAACQIIERLGHHRCRIVELPYKDANECLQKGLSAQEIKHYFDTAKCLDPVELKSAFTVTTKIQDWINPPDDKPIGYQAPWKKSHDKILFRPHELNVWTGINGHGKSQLLGNVILDMMNQGARVCLASLEMRPEIFLGRLVKQASAMTKPSNAYIGAVTEWFSGKLWYIDVLGKIEFKRLIDVFEYGLKRYGIDVFIIDSFMMLSEVYEDDFKSQKLCIEQLCQFKNQFSAQVHLVVHPRKGADESSIPGKLDAKGTGTITDAADNCFAVWRNKAKEHASEKLNNNQTLSDKELALLQMPDALLRCDKQRNGVWEGNLGLWYDKLSCQYLETDYKKACRYVDYSCLND